MHERTENDQGYIASNEINRNIGAGTAISRGVARAVRERTLGIAWQILAGRPGTTRHKILAAIIGIC